VPSLGQEAAFWEQKATDAHHTFLDTVQASAGKWQTAIAAFLGAYTTAGFLIAPSAAASLPVHGAEEIVLLVLYGLAGLAGIVAIFLANLANQGIPQILSGTPITGQTLYKLTVERAKSARRRLSWAIKWAATAGLLIVIVSVSVLVGGVSSRSRTYARWITTTGAYCGRLIDPHGVLELSLAGGAVKAVAGGALSTVTACP